MGSPQFYAEVSHAYISLVFSLFFFKWHNNLDHKNGILGSCVRCYFALLFIGCSFTLLVAEAYSVHLRHFQKRLVLNYSDCIIMKEIYFHLQDNGLKTCLHHKSVFLYYASQE